jgi:DNA modification methylase
MRAPAYDRDGLAIFHGDALEVLRETPSDFYHCCVCSPPYWRLRSYLDDDDPLKRLEFGQENTPAEYVSRSVEIFQEVRRVLRPEGTLWLNLGDSYARDGLGPRPIGLKPKDLVGIPWRVALALQDAGWWLRMDIIWEKPAPMPESVRDRPVRAHEYVFELARSEQYFYDAEAVKEKASKNSHPRGMTGIGKKGKNESSEDPRKRGFNDRWRVKQNESFQSAVKDLVETRNLRSVWKINPRPYREAHFATYPVELAERCIRAGTSEMGCCSKCGAPWERSVDRQRTVDGEPSDLGKFRVGGKYTAQGIAHSRIETRTRTVGWEPTCNCDVELNSKYIQMSDRRLSAATAQRDLFRRRSQG